MSIEDKRFVSQADFARYAGVSMGAVTKMVLQGRIALTPDNKIDIEAATADLKAKAIRPSKAVENINAKDEAKSESEQSEHDISNYHQAKTLKEKYAAMRERLKYQQETSELIPSAQVERDFFSMARSARNVLQTVPDRLSAVLADMSDSKLIHILLAEEMRRICDEIAKKSGSKRGSAQRMDDGVDTGPTSNSKRVGRRTPNSKPKSSSRTRKVANRKNALSKGNNG